MSDMRIRCINFGGLLFGLVASLLAVSCSTSVKTSRETEAEEVIDVNNLLEDEEYTSDLETADVPFFELSASDAAPWMKELRDGYNALLIQTTIWSAVDYWIRFDTRPDSLISAIDFSVIANSDTREKLENYRSELLKLTPRRTSEVFEKMYELKSDLMNNLIDTYKSTNYISLSEDEYWEKVDKKQFVSDYDSLYEARAENEQLCMELKTRFAAATTFNERAIFAIEIAHAGDGSLCILDKLLRQGVYSPYLYEMWRTWRCIYQYMNGSSKDSDLLNDEFNTMRRVVAETIWEYILNHPDDEIAINEFVIFSGLENIYRYGTYPYGNQNMMEQVEIFPERYDIE